MVDGGEDRGRRATVAGRKSGVEVKLGFIADPLKRNIYWALRARPASAAEVAAGLGVAIEKVQYQMRSMREAGILEFVGKTRRRGVSEGLFHVCDREMMISAAELAQAKPSLVERSHLAFIAGMWNEVRASAARGGDVACRFGHLTKVDLLLDGRGWSEASRLLTDAAVEIKASRSRLPVRGDGPYAEHRVFLVLFETPFADPEVGSRPRPRDASERVAEADDPGARKPLGARQLEIVKSLTFHPASARELADRLLLPVHKVKGSLRSMRDRGLVVVSERRTRRNTVENVYAIDSRRHETTLDDLDRASPRQLLEHYDALTRSACGDLVEAVRSGSLRRRSDHVLMRIPFPDDDELKEMTGGILRRTFAATLQVAEASRARLRTSGETPTPAQSTILSSSTAG